MMLVRATLLVRVQPNASAQTMTRSAAEPAATHRRKIEVAISGTTPSINPPYWGQCLRTPRRQVWRSGAREASGVE
jgi:hypothetical protein